MPAWDWVYSVAVLAAGGACVLAAFERQIGRLRGAILIYVGVGLAFGSGYYTYYRHDRGGFVFCEEIRKASDLAAVLNSEKRINGHIETIRTLDGFIRRWVGLPSEGRNNLPFKGWNSPFVEIGDGYGYRLYSQIKVDSNPGGAPRQYVTYHLDVHFGSGEAESSLSMDVPMSFALFKPSTADDEIITNVIATRRSETISSLNAAFQDQQGSIEPFNRYDFFYFAFTIRGASDIIPATTIMRFVVLAQVCVLVGLIGLKEWEHGRTEAKGVSVATPQQ